MGCHSSAVPYCIIGKVTWGVVQAIKVPEERAHLYIGTHGWTVLVKDSEMPPSGLSFRWQSTHSNPRRLADHGDIE